MNRELREDRYIQVLEEELVPAMGCTEPIAVAYGAAVATSVLGEEPESVEISVSGSILKNAKSVVVPNTGGMKGIEASVAAGILSSDPSKELRILEDLGPKDRHRMEEILQRIPITVKQAPKEKLFDIIITLKSREHFARVRITDSHTNVTEITLDGQKVFSAEEKEETEDAGNRDFLRVKDIYVFAETVPLWRVEGLLRRQIQYNLAIAEEGMKKDYGANIGRILAKGESEGVVSKAKAMAAAASDARMGGCELPVIINSGSGNQGITASVPVYIYGRERGFSEEKIYRALLISNLLSIHIKSGIGRLSAYCGAVSAGAASAAAIAYLEGKGYEGICHTLMNALSITSGLICDGAKPSCAGKIATSLDGGFLGYEMYRTGNNLSPGDGIMASDVEKTIRNVWQLAFEGMKGTNEEILQIMVEKDNVLPIGGNGEWKEE